MKEKDAIEIKQKLVNLCRESQSKSVDSAKEAMNEAQQALNEYGPNKDRYDSFRDQLIGRRDMLARQYQQALSELNTLDKIDPSAIRDTVEFGAVIVCDTCRLFVSISAGKINLDINEYYAISPGVPLCKAMAGLKKGDSFEFNNKKQSIIDLF